MRAELLNIDWNEQLRALHSQRGRRSDGVHLSTIVGRIINKIDPKRFGSSGEIDPAMAHQGFVWEDVLSTAFAPVYGVDARQMEVEQDGIVGTMDGFRLRRDSILPGIPPAPNGRVLEAKFTKMSAVNRIESKKFEHWHVRTMGYCHMMGVDEAEYTIMHVNGSYELGGGRFGAVTPRAYRVIFSPREMRDNWRWVMNEYEELMREREGGSRG